MITSTRVQYSISPIPTAVVDRIRQTLLDDFGHHLVVRQPDPAPCRHCLRITQPGERLIVFAYCPFEKSGPYAEVGPVFVHADSCESYDDRARFPEDFRQRVLTMRGYNDDSVIETAELSRAGDPEASIEQLFSNERVRFIHVRNPAWGCYDFRVDRRLE